MHIAFFTDTYFPQVSGVATSIKTLKEELEKNGHDVYIFTTTDPSADDIEKNIIRMTSIPFVSFKDRRIIVRGMWTAYRIAHSLKLDIIHTHTEFGVGVLGKLIGRRLNIPVVHTYHTMYEDYLHYIAKGKIIRPTHVKYLVKTFVNHLSGVICPSQKVVHTLKKYRVAVPLRVIPTGIQIKDFESKEIEKNEQAIRSNLGIDSGKLVLLSLSRLSYEKNIQTIIDQFPQVVKAFPDVLLVIVGKGPYRKTLEEKVTNLNLTDYVNFTGEIPHDYVGAYYRTANYFVSASKSETQGLTYAEALASETQCIVEGDEYLNALIDDERLGVTFSKDEDFCDTLIDYIRKGLVMDVNLKNKKLNEISAQKFSENVCKFYEEILANHFDHSLL